MSEMFPLTLDGVVVRRRGKTVIGPVDLTINQGGPTIVLGPNGSGKTTLLRVMHGVERINDGTVTWATDQLENHAFVFQSPIIMRRSVFENLAYPLRLLRRPKDEISQTVTQWIKRIGLEEQSNFPASRLSGGERQKMALARALIRDPDVLFLDEPCANLDGFATREIEALLQETVASGTRIIMATHDMGQARRLARDVVFLLDGKVHETGDAQSILSTPQTSEFAAFLRGDIVT